MESATTQAEDAEAMRRCQAGDISGLDDLVRRYQLTAIRMAYLLVRDRDAAEDIVQDSFLSVYRGSAQFRSGAAFAPWFSRIVLNTARQYQRARSRRRERSLEALGEASPLATAPADQSPAQEAERAELRAAVLDALQRLPLRQRETLVLRFYCGYTTSEIATALNAPHGTVRWRLHAALRAFEGAVRQVYPWLVTQDDSTGDSVAALLAEPGEETAL